MSGLTGVRHADPCTCERCCRKAAFGAIRRDAQEARDWEAFGGDGHPIRRAIRAAIGSEKS